MCGNAATERPEFPSTDVVLAIVEREGVDPTDLETPLCKVIDPDALDTLYPSDGTAPPHGRVTFSYNGYNVRVTADRDVRISARDEL